jgi:hypothetical protein
MSGNLLGPLYRLQHRVHKLGPIDGMISCGHKIYELMQDPAWKFLKIYTCDTGLLVKPSTGDPHLFGSAAQLEIACP